MNLLEWTISYIEHKDVMDGRLQGYEEEEEGIRFTFDHGDEYYTVRDELEITDGNIVCLNTVENKEKLVEHWDEAVDADPRIIFANPDANSKWIIKPATHDHVADPENLEEGLETLQENTELVKE